ncbi:hypothetical protein B0O99DRAFT_622842 [Bisporella sp. PMI_857]|nr:hypothetical protein B0O99DRAFT_622842 [Bisporella sp. PMI_857]
MEAKADALHLQFTTNYITSSRFPQLLTNPESSLDCVSYEASSGGYIAGFCGSFSDPRKQLHCFGITSATTGIF